MSGTSLPASGRSILVYFHQLQANLRIYVRVQSIDGQKCDVPTSYLMNVFDRTSGVLQRSLRASALLSTGSCTLLFS